MYHFCNTFWYKSRSVRDGLPGTPTNISFPTATGYIRQSIKRLRDITASYMRACLSLLWTNKKGRNGKPAVCEILTFMRNTFRVNVQWNLVKVARKNMILTSILKIPQISIQPSLRSTSIETFPWLSCRTKNRERNWTTLLVSFSFTLLLETW